MTPEQEWKKKMYDNIIYLYTNKKSYQAEIMFNDVLREAHNNALKMVEEGLPKNNSGYKEAIMLLTKRLKID